MRTNIVYCQGFDYHIYIKHVVIILVIFFNIILGCRQIPAKCRRKYRSITEKLNIGSVARTFLCVSYVRAWYVGVQISAELGLKSVVIAI